MEIKKVANSTSFTSTYRIPLVEQNISTAKRKALKEMASQYQNVLFPGGNQGNVRVSIRKRLDEGFEQKLRRFGFKVFQKFEKHNIPKSRIDNYVKEELKSGNFRQFGKQKS